MFLSYFVEVGPEASLSLAYLSEHHTGTGIFDENMAIPCVAAGVVGFFAGELRIWGWGSDLCGLPSPKTPFETVPCVVARDFGSLHEKFSRENKGKG